MRDPFYVRTGIEGLLDRLYLEVDRQLQIKGININEDNGPIIDNMWYFVHFLRKSPDFFRHLHGSQNTRSIPRLAHNIVASYLPTSSRKIMQEVNEGSMGYHAFNIDRTVKSVDDIIDSIDDDVLRVIISACSKGQVYQDDNSAPRNPGNVGICPRRHETSCVYSKGTDYNSESEKPCIRHPCRVGRVLNITNRMARAETEIIFQSYSLMEDGNMSIFDGEEGNFYVIELCPATLRRMEMAARMFPKFKGVVVTFSEGSSCRTLYDRPIRWGGDRDRIITRFAGEDPTLYLLDKLNLSSN